MSFNRKNLIFTILESMVVLTVTLIIFLKKPVQLEIGKESIRISGMNGLDIKLEDINAVAIKETLPKEVKESNTKKSGDISVGNFKANDSGEIKVFTYFNQGPYIYINTKNKEEKYVIINYKDRKHTEDLYKILLNNLKIN